MRNRAKCKLCNEIIESFALLDCVSCKCGEISIEGGTQAYKAAAKNWDNFLRVDDDGVERAVTVISKGKVSSPEQKADVNPLDMPPITKEDKLAALDDMIKSYESLPSHAMGAYATNYDVLSVLLLVKSLLGA